VSERAIEWENGTLTNVTDLIGLRSGFDLNRIIGALDKTTDLRASRDDKDACDQSYD